VGKSYKQYCAVAHALDLVGERWSLLVVRELLEDGPLRYTDLHCRLEGCGTNILAARLKELERNGIIRRRKLPPPAPATVYELTEYGEALRTVLHHLAHWGARSLHPPRPGEADREPGWLAGALRLALPAGAEGRIEFRIGDEVASLLDGDVVPTPADPADAVVEGDPAGLYRLLVDRDLDAVAVHGSRAAVRRLLETLPPPTPAPVAEPVATAA
jgi:DNA-binding HxlR family transcriptional regulator